MKGRYALRLCCAGCGKYLFGDVGRYRHPPPTCEGFLAAKPVVRCRRARNREGIDTRIKGHSYPQEWYEDAVGELLGKVGELDDVAMTEIVRLYGEGLAKPDELTLARIEREREEASQRLAKTRDVAAWQATMARLDAEQQVARQPRQQQRMAPDEVVAYLRSLPTLWNDAGPEGRQALASALFTKLEVEGYTKMRYELTPDAVTLGLGAALPAQTETGGHTGGFGRGERGSASLAHLRFRPQFVLENVTPAARSWPAVVPEGRLMARAAADPPAAGGPAGVHPGRVGRGRRLRAGHQRDDGAPASVGAVPADGLPERGAGGVLLGRGQVTADCPCSG